MWIPWNWAAPKNCLYPPSDRWVTLPWNAASQISPISQDCSRKSLESHHPGSKKCRWRMRWVPRIRGQDGIWSLFSPTNLCLSLPDTMIKKQMKIAISSLHMTFAKAFSFSNQAVRSSAFCVWKRQIADRQIWETAGMDRSWSRKQADELSSKDKTHKFNFILQLFRLLFCKFAR